MVLAREITKLYEEVLRGSISDVLEVLCGRKEIKGECVILLAGDQSPQAVDIDNLADLLRWYRDNTKSSLKDAVKRVSVDLNVSRSQTYKEALGIWHEERKEE